MCLACLIWCLLFYPSIPQYAFCRGNVSIELDSGGYQEDLTCKVKSAIKTKKTENLIAKGERAGDINNKKEDAEKAI